MFLLERFVVFAIFGMAHLLPVAVMAAWYLALPSSWSRPWWDTLIMLVALPSLHQAPTLLLVEVIRR